jgi:hypothetical protein
MIAKILHSQVTTLLLVVLIAYYSFSKVDASGLLMSEND